MISGGEPGVSDMPIEQAMKLIPDAFIKDGDKS
jgi:hypothetical protein